MHGVGLQTANLQAEENHTHHSLQFGAPLHQTRTRPKHSGVLFIIMNVVFDCLQFRVQTVNLA